MPESSLRFSLACNVIVQFPRHHAGRQTIQRFSLRAVWIACCIKRIRHTYIVRSRDLRITKWHERLPQCSYNVWVFSQQFVNVKKSSKEQEIWRDSLSKARQFQWVLRSRAVAMELKTCVKRFQTAIQTGSRFILMLYIVWKEQKKKNKIIFLLNCYFFLFQLWNADFDIKLRIREYIDLIPSLSRVDKRAR